VGEGFLEPLFECRHVTRGGPAKLIWYLRRPLVAIVNRNVPGVPPCGLQ
jgi:hypothetical protein